MRRCSAICSWHGAELSSAAIAAEFYSAVVGFAPSYIDRCSFTRGYAYIQGNYHGSFIAELFVPFEQLSEEHRDGMRRAARQFLKRNRDRWPNVVDVRDACLREPLVDVGLEALQCLSLRVDLRILTSRGLSAVVGCERRSDSKGAQYDVVELASCAGDSYQLLTNRFLAFGYHIAEHITLNLRKGGTIKQVRDAVFDYVLQNVRGTPAEAYVRQQWYAASSFADAMTATGFPRAEFGAPLVCASALIVAYSDSRMVDSQGCQRMRS